MGKKAYGWENGGETQRKVRAANRAESGDEFVQLELSVEQKKELKESYADVDTISLAIDEMLEDEIKVTIKTDNRGNGYVAFAFAGGDSENVGYILTGRGGSSTRALRELLYKHYNVLGKQWSLYHSRAADAGENDW